MKKILYSLLAILSINIAATAAAPPSIHELTGTKAHLVIAGAEKVNMSDVSDVPAYVKFRTGSEPAFNDFNKWAHSHFTIPASAGFKLLNQSADKIGYIHYRYQETINNIPVEGTMYIVHVKNNMVESMNGMIFGNRSKNSGSKAISEAAALSNALAYTHASVYRWQIPALEQQLKITSHNLAATYYPAAVMAYAPQNGDYTSGNYHLCYKFDIYAMEPLSRKYVFVDAATGQVIHTVNRIDNGDATATAVTVYSGNHTMTTDSVNATTYRLREAGRGNGIETYNLQGGTNYMNTDFTDADNFWNNVNPQLDQYATDAHWGAEMTYDFYFQNFGRNSIDDAGFALLSYVHYGTNFVNAFWDGQEMTYGDGDGTYSPLTSLDVTGHEISHGLTNFTSGLGASPESGAMNEGFSDCMGNAIRQFGKQSPTIDWLIGDELGGAPFRDMADPNSTNNPDTYLGTNWDFGQEVHQNSTVFSHAFYLVSEGGNGTNDNGDVYTVSALGLDKASAIWFRMNTVYLFSAANYPDARYYAIQAAIDLYGPCTPEVIATTDAWYAVGVGAEFVPGVTSDFSAPVVAFCQIPATADFVNASTNAGFYTWDFGDGGTSTATNPSHTYANYGTYTVKLISDGGTCGIDSMTKTAYISVDTLNPCIVILPPNGTATTQTSCTGQLFDSGGPSANYSDNTDATVTISPLGASTVTLNFSLFDMENTFDFLTIYDGPTTASPQIGSYTGNTLPNGGVINSTGGSITLRQTSDQGVTGAGFALTWQCQLANVAPTPNFIANDTLSCTGIINFTDLSINGPTSWAWDFGDLGTSTLQSPSHTYTASGTYTVQLTVSNGFGSNSLTKTSYITVNLPVAPAATGDTICPGVSTTLTATGADSLRWFTVPVGGISVATGGTFTTPVLAATTTYYVESDIYPSPVSEGPVDNTFGTGTIFTNNNYHDLIFNCLTPATLVSVKMYAQGAGNRTIELNDAGGNNLQTATVNLPDGMSIVTLNFPLPVANNLELGLQGNVNVFRNNAGATFPYNLSGIVSITGTNAGDPGYYYYFYDWQLQGPPCTSARTPVTVTVNATATASFTFAPVANTVTFTDNSVGATSWLWDFGDGNTSTLQNPVHTYAANGTYIVTLTINGGICTAPDIQTIVITGVGIEQHSNQINLSVYPNPVKDLINIEWYQSEQENVSMQVTDNLGRSVYDVPSQLMNSGIHKMNIHTNEFSNGIYFLKIQGQNSAIVRKITVMK
jgi:Zn-dependent metalloprotease